MATVVVANAKLAVLQTKQYGHTEEVKEGIASSFFFLLSVFSVLLAESLIVLKELQSDTVRSEAKRDILFLISAFCVTAGHVLQSVKATVLHTTLQACFSTIDISLISRWAAPFLPYLPVLNVLKLNDPGGLIRNHPIYRSLSSSPSFSTV